MIDPGAHIDLSRRRDDDLARDAATYALARSLRPRRERLPTRILRLAFRRIEHRRPVARELPASAA